jgi:hypothetical protein
MHDSFVTYSSQKVQKNVREKLIREKCPSFRDASLEDLMITHQIVLYFDSS